ncbi:MAG TPA: protein phosphatase 2C domain-containing protein [Thermoflexales bacterium]|jgi:protein phosphatase|nr:protein phosphatase 2C domain-containing protein [Anaerolineae bacterium]HQV26916.1 protein phosphatase 2C domain-containing protein [Thermoflexales bacterium]HQX09412.1 protein phosphatase 2C domain-containing protein [Thermoflexales bacterium]
MTQKTLSRRPVSNQPNGALGLAWGKHTHQGPRAENQDAVIVVGPRDPQIARKGVLLIVCDGVGGAQGGRRASEIASTTAYQAFYADPSPDPRVSIESAIRKANAAVKEEAARNPAIASMATTIVVTVVVGNTLYVGHVGDSRAYLFHADGRNERITRDHSWVHEQVERGVLTEEQAKENPMRSVITRSLGAASNNTSEQRQFTLAPGDAVLVCTDGLHGVVSDEQMRVILKRSPEPQRAAEALVATGLANKTTDNTTAAVLVVTAPLQAKSGAPIGLLLGLGAAALAVALAAVLLLGRPSGGGGDPGQVATPTSPLIALPTPRGTGGTSILIGGDATVAPTAVVDPGKPTSTLSPDLPTPTPVPTRPPIVATAVPATPTPQPEAPTSAPTNNNGGGPAPTSPPAQPTSTPANAQPTSTTGAAPTTAPATATPILPIPTLEPPPTEKPKPTKPPPPPKP